MNDEHRRRRIEIIIEAPLLEKVITEVQACGAKGYTVLRGHAGKGEKGSWQLGQISPAQHMMIVIIIADADITDRILSRLAEDLALYSGVVSVSDVQVMRPQRF